MRRHELDKHRRKLDEIRDILASMKTLAAMETHKLGRFIEAQNQMSQTIEEIAADFLYFNPAILPETKTSPFELILIIGSERGFCGDFNDKLVEQLHRRFSIQDWQRAKLIVVGNKLQPMLTENDGQNIAIRGADIADEIVTVLDSLAQVFAGYHPIDALYVLHHGEAVNDIITDHFLFHSLQRILYLSLMAENQHRVQHLERATRHLEDSTEQLNRKINALRQEEIIEEIEVILLNAASA